jgi:hypothetical protein
MDPISESDLQSAFVLPLSTPSSLSFPPVKMPASPRARPAMPAGPRIRKAAQNNTSTPTSNGRTIPTNGRRVSSDSIAAFTSGRNSPNLSSSSPAQSPTLDRRFFHQLVMEEKEVQTDDITPLPPPSKPENSASESVRLPTPAPTAGFRVNPKPVTLPVPKPITFVAEPISFRGLTLEAAQWTFSSDQLRDVVSRAIRDSAKESFIKLLSLDALDKEVPAEFERLETLKFTTQAQHRFHFQRRTNLLQSLNALATTIPHTSDDGISPLASLTSQLAEITAAMDRYTESLLHIADHKAQLAHVQDSHLSSALAMALRKLNGSYSKRTADLKQAQTRIEELRAELEEAWKVAEDLAQEIDDLENFEQDYGMGEEDEDENPGLTVDGEDFATTSAINAKLVGITGKAFASKAMLVASPTSETSADGGTSATNPKRERAQSTSSSGKGVTSGRGRSSRVSAARRRSIRTSKANLRLPKQPGASGSEGSASGASTPIRRRSRSNTKRSPTEPPSVPPIPSRVGPSTNGQMNTSFLELSRPGSPQQSSDEDIPPVPALHTTISGQTVAVVDVQKDGAKGDFDPL